MKYHAKSVSLSYVAAEDRILWSSRCEGELVVAAWVTRRHLAIIMPRLAEWLDRQSPLQRHAVAPSPAREEIRHLEHRAAQQKIKAVRGYTRSVEPDVSFMLHCFSVSLLREGVLELSLLSADGERQLALSGSFDQLHKLVRELLDMADSAGWALPDPWQESLPAAPAVEASTRH